METQEETKPKIEVEKPKEEDNKKTTATVEEEKPNMSIIDQAREAAQLLREQLGQLKIENDRLEKLRAATILGGKSEAGQPPAKPKELSDKEFAEKALRGDFNR